MADAVGEDLVGGEDEVGGAPDVETRLPGIPVHEAPALRERVEGKGEPGRGLGRLRQRRIDVAVAVPVAARPPSVAEQEAMTLQRGIENVVVEGRRVERTEEAPGRRAAEGEVEQRLVLSALGELLAGTLCPDRLSDPARGMSLAHVLGRELLPERDDPGRVEADPLHVGEEHALAVAVQRLADQVELPSGDGDEDCLACVQALADVRGRPRDVLVVAGVQKGLMRKVAHSSADGGGGHNRFAHTRNGAISCRAFVFGCCSDRVWRRNAAVPSGGR